MEETKEVIITIKQEVVDDYEEETPEEAAKHINSAAEVGLRTTAHLSGPSYLSLVKHEKDCADDKDELCKPEPETYWEDFEINETKPKLERLINSCTDCIIQDFQEDSQYDDSGLADEDSTSHHVEPEGIKIKEEIIDDDELKGSETSVKSCHVWIVENPHHQEPLSEEDEKNNESERKLDQAPLTHESVTVEKKKPPRKKKKAEKNHPCPHCEYRAPHPGQLRAHIMFKHTNEKPRQCPFCDYRTVMGGQLKSHIMAKHTNEKPHHCKLCDYRATQSSQLKSHMMFKHTNEKPKQCPHCEYRTVMTGQLKAHIMAKHTNEKPHKCPHCEYRATQGGDINKHIRSKHSSEKPFQCPFCDHKASLSGSLRKHIMAKHTNEKPYQCPYCEYRATQSGQLRGHVMFKHTNEKPHQCSHCGYKATRADSLKSHIVRKHPELNTLEESEVTCDS